MKVLVLSLLCCAIAFSLEQQPINTQHADSADHAVSGFDIAQNLPETTATEITGIAERMLGLVRDAWDSEWTRNPQSVLEKLGAGPVRRAGSRDPPVRVSRKGGHKVFKNARFPNYELRVQEPFASLRIDSVQQYSGYVDILDEDKHFFFWIWESRSDPEHDPVLLWLNGGPGCSSSAGEFYELGPARINASLETTSNPYSWNTNATVIFLDQPVNVGYSYSSARVKDSVMAGEDVYAFLEVLREALPQYSHQKFHIGGESYAGKYIPAIGKGHFEPPRTQFRAGVCNAG